MAVFLFKSSSYDSKQELLQLKALPKQNITIFLQIFHVEKNKRIVNTFDKNIHSNSFFHFTAV